MRVPFEDFVVARGPALVRFAHALCGDRHLAEDLVQEVLVKAHRRWAGIDNPEAYLKSALCKEFVSWRRSRSRREIPSEDVCSGQAGLDAQLTEHDEFWRSIVRLPFRQRAVLVLRYWEGLSDREIARLLACSEGTVRSSAARAFAALRLQPEIAGHNIGRRSS
jgi:RNA polymerase sigma-70 factor (sigma-E family)